MKFRFNNLIQIFHEAYKIDGISGLFKGYTVSLIGALPYAGCAYFVYETCKITHRSKCYRMSLKLKDGIY